MSRVFRLGKSWVARLRPLGHPPPRGQRRRPRRCCRAPILWACYPSTQGNDGEPPLRAISTDDQDAASHSLHSEGPSKRLPTPVTVAPVPETSASRRRNAQRRRFFRASTPTLNSALPHPSKRRRPSANPRPLERPLAPASWNKRPSNVHLANRHGPAGFLAV